MGWGRHFSCLIPVIVRKGGAWRRRTGDTIPERGQIMRKPIIAFCVPFLFAVSACDEGGWTNENNVPSIYNEVELMYAGMNMETSCSKLNDAIKNYRVRVDNLESACSEYQTSLNKAGGNDPSRLAEYPNNAGYYMTSYILLNRWTTAITSCIPGSGAETNAKTVMAAWTKLFEDAECDALLTHAATVSNNHKTVRYGG